MSAGHVSVHICVYNRECGCATDTDNRGLDLLGRGFNP